jgi:hypothetical protein
LAQGPVTVTGSYQNVTGITIQGVPAQVQDGTFSGDTVLLRGTNLIEADGRSAAGVRYATHVSVIAGPLGNPDEPVASAAAVRLNQGGLDLALEVAAAAIDGPTIEALLLAGNPVFEQSGDYDVTVEARSFRLGDTKLKLQPGEGSARLTVELQDFALGVHVDARYGAAFAELDQTASATKAVITGDVGLRVERGILRVDLSKVDVVLTGFSLDTSRWPSWLTGELTDLVLAEVVEGVLRVAIVDIVPPLLEEQLGSLELSFSTTLLERTASVEATLRDARFDPAGLALGVDLDVEIEGQTSKAAPGFLVSPASVPTPDRSADLAVSVLDDLMNSALFEAWRADLLSLRLSSDDGSLPAYLLDAIGGARSGIVTIDAALPPTLVEVDKALRVQVGEMQVRLDTIDGARGEYLVFAMGGHVDLDVKVENGMLKLVFGQKDLRLTVRDTDWTGSLVEVTAEIEKLLPLDLALGLLTDLEIPLPSLGGLTLASAAVTRDTTTLHTNLALDLEVAD